MDESKTTVKELIEKLQQFPQNAEVRAGINCIHYPIDCARIISKKETDFMHVTHEYVFVVNRDTRGY